MFIYRAEDVSSYKIDPLVISDIQLGCGVESGGDDGPHLCGYRLAPF